MKRFPGVISLLAGPVLLTLTLPALVHANQIAQFSGPDSSDFIFKIIGSTQYITATSQISFAFSSTADTPFGDTDIPATLVLNAASPVGDTGDGTPDTHGDFDGSFTITNDALGTILLVGNFSSSMLAGAPQDQTAALTANQAAFTSDYLSFSPSNPQTFSVNLWNLAPFFGEPGYLPVGMDGLGSGSFSADTSPAPVNSTAASADPATPAASDPAAATVATEASDPAAPEPITFLMSGVALIGLSFLLRARKQRQ